MNVKELEISARKAIKKLRRDKLSKGLPFMINSDMLVEEQCFLEYPDGIIKIAKAAFKEHDFQIIMELSMEESDTLRKKLKLI